MGRQEMGIGSGALPPCNCHSRASKQGWRMWQDKVDFSYFMRSTEYPLSLVRQCKCKLPFTQSTVQVRSFSSMYLLCSPPGSCVPPSLWRPILRH